MKNNWTPTSWYGNSIIMDIDFQKKLIKLSLEKATECKHIEPLRDLFLMQAQRLDEELSLFTKENPKCTNATVAKKIKKKVQNPQRKLRRQEKNNTQITSQGEKEK